MKILWLSHLVPYPPKGGVLQRSYNLIKEVSKYHELTLLAFIQPDLLKSMFPSVEAGLIEAKEHLGAFCKHVEFVDIPCEQTRYGKHILALKSLFTRDPYSINWLKSDKMRSVIQDSKSNEQFDLVHFDTISLAPFSTLFPDLPKVLDHHNIESQMMLRRSDNEENSLKKFYYKQEGKKLHLYEKEICRTFDLHITCSSLDSDLLTNIDSSLTIREVPNGVDIEYFFPQPKNEKVNNLIFAGRLNWYPNEDAMLFFAKEVWPLLRNQMPDVVMNVVGSSPNPYLLKLAAEDNNFIVHGFVDDVRDYISSASIYVCPIRDGGGTKLKMLDAFAMGIATVAHPIACEGLDTKDDFNVLLASTPEQFVEKIRLLLMQPEARNKLGENARNTAISKYAFTSIGNNLSDLFIKTINNTI